MYVRKLRPSVLSLTELISAGFWKIREASSSISDMFLPPKAMLWADVGRFRKLKILPLSCAFVVAEKRTDVMMYVRRRLKLMMLYFEFQR
jgi:hypothetical protein